ncbi:lipopolysaccharide biosynthesis protein [Nonomuraea longicatena]|uniref:lipopolysaccharide biosynthesis protein n=1 Tax=Nonomuraea longicatena TaxID=83682 RepID=UPI0031D5B7AA
MAGAGVGAGAQFLLAVVVTRAAEVETAGAFFTTAALALMIAGVAKLDAGGGVVYFVARARTCGYQGASGYIRAGLVPGVCVAVIAGVVFHPQLGAASFALPMMVAADILLAATRGLGGMRPTVLLDGVLLPVGQLILVAAVVFTPAWHLVLTPAPASMTAPVPAPVSASVFVTSPGWLVGAWVAPYLPLLVLSALSLRGRVPRTPPLPGAARELWRHTAPRSAAGAIQAVFQRLDIVIVGALGGLAQAAVYTAATRFKVVGQLANQGLAQTAQPRLIRAMAEGDLVKARTLYQATTIWLVVMTWPVWLAYAAVAPWLLTVFGSPYGSAVPIALVLSATMMLATACGMVDVVLTSAGHTTASLLNLVAALAVTVLLDLALIPTHGALGAALGWSGGVIVKNLLPLWQIHHRYGLRPFGRHSLTALRPSRWTPPHHQEVR